MAGIDHFSMRLRHKYARSCELIKLTLPLLDLTDLNSLGVRFSVRLLGEIRRTSRRNWCAPKFSN